MIWLGYRTAMHPTSIERPHFTSYDFVTISSTSKTSALHSLIAVGCAMTST